MWHVWRGGAYRVLVGNKLRERDYLEDLGADGRIILKWILRKYGWELWTGMILFSIGAGDRFL